MNKPQKSKIRIFEDWDITPYERISPDKKICLWIANGFSCFADYNSPFCRSDLYLRGLNIFERYKLWRAYKRELRYRSMKNIFDRVQA